jgi:hypothetical protein
VAALARGDYAQALAAYRSLARARPQRPVFAAIATILERKLRARCAARDQDGDMPCDALEP